MTWKRSFNRKFKQPPDQPNSISAISQLSQLPYDRLAKVFDTSLRENKSTQIAWADLYRYAITHTHK